MASDRKRRSIQSLYLGGPIDMSDFHEHHTWKDLIATSLPEVVCFDPMTSYRNAKNGSPDFIQSTNTTALINSDAVILNFQPNVQTVGTVVELGKLAMLPSFRLSRTKFYHERTGQHIFIIVKSLTDIPVYLKQYENYITDSIDEIINTVTNRNKEFSRGRSYSEFLPRTTKPIIVRYYANTPGIDDPLFQAYPTDVGYDLALIETLSLGPGESKDFHTGVWLDMPNLVWARITHRSSTFRKRGLLVLEGTIDPAFRGELMVCIHNITDKHITADAGSRLAQVIFMPVLPISLIKVDSMDNISQSDRGTNGFGSSGY